ncbi:MAG: Dabb family protein [Proteobacteria bacterium]|nr:Dabb family protein [Pseudomonadota bacterium]
MLRHMVMFKWNDGASEEDKRAVEAGLVAPPALIPEIRRYEFGPDAGLAAGNFDLDGNLD